MVHIKFDKFFWECELHLTGKSVGEEGGKALEDEEIHRRRLRNEHGGGDRDRTSAREGGGM